MKLMGQSLVFAISLAMVLSGSVVLADSHSVDSTDMRLRAALTGEHRSEEKRLETFITTHTKR